MEIKRSVTECGDLIVKIFGDLDALSVSEIRPDFELIAEDKQQQQIILDLEQVGFIDSSGIGAIVFLYKRLKADGRELELMGARGQPKHLLELLRIHQVISIR
ncbi:STAS domain-containing protein [Photobacterium nomapromontoriensis]|uniref:STAS domain-containing protein n=1 Tax=Photobacterium nomapromontoriensis TaxID=2910237 RepID=UPI003D0D81CA